MTKDIVARLRAADADPRNWRRMYGEAADEIEALRADLDKSAKRALSAVHAERAAIVELIESFARSWDQDDVTSWHEAAKRIAVAIKARGNK